MGGIIALLAPTAIVAGLSLTAGVLPAAAQYYYDRPPGYDVPIPPAPVPEAPWARRPWGPPPGAYVDDAMPRDAMAALLARRGYTLESPLRRRGDVYVTDVMDRQGDILRLTVDAFSGAILHRRVIAEVVPDWRDAPRPGRGWRERGWDDEGGSDRRDSERYAAREPDRPVEPLVIPAPPMPKLPPLARVPHPPARPSELGAGEMPGSPSQPPVAQAGPQAGPQAGAQGPSPRPDATATHADRPAPAEIAPPDLPEVPPPSF